jgi:hypothetical protein
MGGKEIYITDACNVDAKYDKQGMKPGTLKLRYTDKADGPGVYLSRRLRVLRGSHANCSCDDRSDAASGFQFPRELTAPCHSENPSTKIWVESTLIAACPSTMKMYEAFRRSQLTPMLLQSRVVQT